MALPSKPMRIARTSSVPLPIAPPFCGRPVPGFVWLTLLCLLLLPRPGFCQQPFTLEQAVRRALENNERALAANEQLDAARARVRRARALLLPELTVSGNYTRRTYETPREVDGQTYYLRRRGALSTLSDVSLNLFDARAYPLYKQATREREAARFGASEVRRALAFDAGDAYLICLSAERLLEAARRRRDFALKSLADARARFGAQLVGSNDVTRAELELATAERQVTRAQGDMEVAYLDLGYLVGDEVQGSLIPPQGLEQDADALAATVESHMVEAQNRRGDVRERELRAEALRVGAVPALMRFWPRLTIDGVYRTTNEGGLEDRTRDWWLGARATWDLFDGGQWQAETSEKLALARSAELEAKALRRRVVVDARAAVVGWRSARAAVEQARVAAEVAQTNARQTAELYRQGLTGALEVADANVSLFEAEVAHVRERYGLTQAVLGLNEALGLDPFSREPQP